LEYSTELQEINVPNPFIKILSKIS